MAVIVPAIGQLLWGEPLNNALLGLDAAIQGKVSTTEFTNLTAQVAAIQVQASNAQTTANNALNVANNVPGTITVSGTAPASPIAGKYWDNGANLYRYNGTSWQPPNYVRPSVSTQVSMPSIGAIVGGAFTDFTSGQWAPITVSVPASGMVKVTIGGAVRNTNTTSSTGWLTWRASGAITLGSPYENRSVSTYGSRTYASRTYVITGLTAGVNLTITPQFMFSSVGASTSVTGATDGQLIVEPIVL
jgi:hypothetical protein